MPGSGPRSLATSARSHNISRVDTRRLHEAKECVLTTECVLLDTCMNLHGQEESLNVLSVPVLVLDAVEKLHTPRPKVCAERCFLCLGQVVEASPQPSKESCAASVFRLVFSL